MRGTEAELIRQSLLFFFFLKFRGIASTKTSCELKLPRLNTPEADATDVAALLDQRYGFDVTLVLNAKRLTIMEKLDKLREIMTEKDSLLVYYAGHGQIEGSPFHHQAQERSQRSLLLHAEEPQQQQGTHLAP